MAPAPGSADGRTSGRGPGSGSPRRRRGRLVVQALRGPQERRRYGPAYPTGRARARWEPSTQVGAITVDLLLLVGECEHLVCVHRGASVPRRGGSPRSCEERWRRHRRRRSCSRGVPENDESRRWCRRLVRCPGGAKGDPQRAPVLERAAPAAPRTRVVNARFTPVPGTTPDAARYVMCAIAVLLVSGLEFVTGSGDGRGRYAGHRRL